MISRARALDLSLVGLISVCWGLNWPAVKIILTQIQPWTLRSLGFAVGAAVLFAYARSRGESLAVPRGQRWRNALTDGTLEAADAVTAADLFRDFPVALLVREG